MALDQPAVRNLPVTVEAPPRPLGFWRAYRAARRNVLEVIPAAAYREPIVSGGGRGAGRGAGRGVGWLMVMDPPWIEHILRTREARYPKSLATLRILKPRQGDSLLTTDRETWRWQRRAMVAPLQGRQLRAFVPAMKRAAEAAARRIGDAALAEGSSGGPVDVYRAMVAATCDVICAATLSGRETIDRDQITAGITSFVTNIARISLLDVLGAPRWVPRLGRLRAARGPDMDALMDRVVEARLQHGPSDPPDMLDAMVAARDQETGRGMDRIELRNNLLSLITAGHETTALALTWSLYLLAMDRDVQARARAAAQDAGGASGAAEDLDRQRYARQVIEEALRLYPPAAFLSRRALEADRIGDREVGPGMQVFLPTYALHRHTLLWDHPGSFDPDRFAPEAARARHRYAYLPFGAGPRACIGANFAMAEAQIILSALLARFSFELPHGFRPRPIMWLTLRPAGGMPLVVRRL